MRNDDARLRLEVEVLLASAFGHALDHVRAFPAAEGGVHIAAVQPVALRLQNHTESNIGSQAAGVMR